MGLAPSGYCTYPVGNVAQSPKEPTKKAEQERGKHTHNREPLHLLDIETGAEREGKCVGRRLVGRVKPDSFGESC